MIFHLEGLQSKQIETLKQMSPFMQERGFYLAGGTALSVYFGHRFSVDLDWFTSNPIEDVQLLVQDLRDYSTAAKAAWLLRIVPRLSSPRANMFKAAFSSRSMFNPQAGQSCTRTDNDF